MDDRENLVELIRSALFKNIELSCNLAENIADHLIANGVTVQNWRDAKTDPPETKTDVLLKFAGYQAVGFFRDDRWYASAGNIYYECYCEPVRWMPIPELPKEETK